MHPSGTPWHSHLQPKRRAALVCWIGFADSGSSIGSQVPLDKQYDMYEKQFTAFLHAVRTGDQSDVRCLFRDAAKTYAASWWITEAAGSPLPDGSVPE